MTTHYLDKAVFESTDRKLKVIYSEGENDWDIQLFLSQESGKYYAKGPFGRWDTVCYVELGEKTQEEINEWIENIKNN